MTDNEFKNNAYYRCANEKCTSSEQTFFRCRFKGSDINKGTARKEHCLAENVILEFDSLIEPQKFAYKYVIINNEEIGGKAYVTNDFETAMSKLMSFASDSMELYEIVDKKANDKGSVQGAKPIYVYNEQTRKIEEYEEYVGMTTTVGLHIEWYTQLKDIEVI